MSDAPDKIKDLLESAINANSAAWTAQSEYFDNLVKRNLDSFSTLSEARDASLREIGESLTFNQAFEANIAYEETVRNEMKKLKDESESDWAKLVARLETIYSVDASGDDRT